LTEERGGESEKSVPVLYVRGNTSVVHGILLILKTSQFAKKFTDKN